jgi:hypothetical protein
MVESQLAALALLLNGSNGWRQQAMEREGVTLFFSECGALVEPGVQQQIEAGEPGTNHSLAGMR